MIRIEVVYSPICEASMAFVGILHEWLENKNVEITSSVFSCFSAYQKKLYEHNGLATNGRMIETCFTDVFYNGRLIDSVPLNKMKIYSALGIAEDDCNDESYSLTSDNISVQQFRKLIINEEIS
ncbi:MAG TPA: hypothetical protein DCM73_01280 [Clostridiales bacterium]|nr:hypothetical protein [Clostridiales bacterium]